MSNIDKQTYLVRLYRKNGNLQEYVMEASSDEMALYNAEKSFNREFVLLDETTMEYVENKETKILKEKRDE